MNRLCVSTTGIESWRQALRPLGGEWKKRSAEFETAVSWEVAREQPSGLPDQIHQAYDKSLIGSATLLLGVAGHKVPLTEHSPELRPSLWAIVDTEQGMMSMTVQSMGLGIFGVVETLSKWMERGYGETGQARRQARWEYIRSYLPTLQNDAGQVPRQLLDCCAASVIEAQRVGLKHATFVVQAFKASEKRFAEFKLLCEAIGVPPIRGGLSSIELAGGVRLGVGWADCPYATDKEIVATVR